MDKERVWDVALSPLRNGKYSYLRIYLPAALSRALIAREMVRAQLKLTKEGILVMPYKGSKQETRWREVVELPESWGK
jgi:hypothetical protein